MATTLRVAEYWSNAYIDRDLVEIIAAPTTTTLTVRRGTSGTVAASHASGHGHAILHVAQPTRIFEALVLGVFIVYETAESLSIDLNGISKREKLGARTPASFRRVRRHLRWDRISQHPSTSS
jgi:hypothetical protein